MEFFFIILIAKCKNVARQFRVENKDGNFMMSQEKARLILLPADKLTSGYCIYMSYFYRQIAKCNCNFRLTYLPISLWTKQSIVFVLFFIITIAKCKNVARQFHVKKKNVNLRFHEKKPIGTLPARELLTTGYCKYELFFLSNHKVQF